MPHRLWKYPCCLKAEPEAVCPDHHERGIFVGWWPTPAEKLARYVSEYGLRPNGAHRDLADRLLDSTGAHCRACRGSGWLGTAVDTAPVACPACEGSGLTWRRSRQQIAEVRAIVLRAYPEAGTAWPADVRQAEGA